MWKQITKEQAWALIKENGYKPIRAILTTNYEPDCVKPSMLISINIQESKCLPFLDSEGFWNEKCYIEVPDEMRYMTKEEQSVWAVTIGYKNHQMRYGDSNWFSVRSVSTPEEYEYRTVEVIDGKIIYGEPKEFKVKEN